MDYFKHKTIWISGASSGIGKALVETLAHYETNLILLSRNMEALQAIKASCSALKALIKVYQFDLEAHDSIQSIVHSILTEHPHIDILINNAGISQRSLAADAVLEVDKQLMNVNYLGTVALTKALLPVFIKQQKGQIATVSSLTGCFATPYRSSYAASKHALHGFFDALRAELFDKNIEICMVCPGFVQTNISVNSLIADGSKLNKMDDKQANGMKSSVFALKMLKAIKKRKKEVYIGQQEVLMVYIKRWCPPLYRYLIRKVAVR